MTRGSSGAYRSVYLLTLAQSGAFAHDHDILEAMLTQTSLNKLLCSHVPGLYDLVPSSEFRGSVGGRPLSLILEAKLPGLVQHSLFPVDASISGLNPAPSLLRLRSLSHSLQRQKLNDLQAAV